jgi:hypothetical protein
MCGVGFIGWLIALAYLFLVGLALTFLLGRGLKRFFAADDPPEDEAPDRSRTG